MDEEKSLEGKVAIVTGASSGIGREAARALARDGCRVSLAARSGDRLDELAEDFERKYGVEILSVVTNVRRESDVNELVERTVEEFGRLDIVVSNAGIGGEGKVEDLDIEEYKAIMETNLDGAVYLTRASLPHIKETNGNYIYIGSRSGIHPDPDLPIYAASKWGLRGFVLSLEADLGNEGIGFTLINPAEVRTKISDDDGVPMMDRYDEGEVMEPEEIAEVIKFAAIQKSHTTLSEVDIYWRGKLDSVFKSNRSKKN